MYKNTHVFLNGLAIDFDSDIGQMYRNDRSQIETHSDFLNFVDKWKFLLPEVDPKSYKSDLTCLCSPKILKMLIESMELQDSFVELAKDELMGLGARFYLRLLLPRTLVLFENISYEYGVPTGAVALQLWNSGRFTETEDGRWTLKPRVES
jgi:hypothetical protein